MSYFPCDIPFMSHEELKRNGITISEDPKGIDVYIYRLDLNVEKAVVEKFPGLIREGTYNDEVIYWVGPNDYKIWHSEFDIGMLGVVYEPLNNVIELIIIQNSMTQYNAVNLILAYCSQKALKARQRLDMFHRGMGATMDYMNEEVFK